MSEIEGILAGFLAGELIDNVPDQVVEGAPLEIDSDVYVSEAGEYGPRYFHVDHGGLRYEVTIAVRRAPEARTISDDVRKRSPR